MPKKFKDVDASTPNRNGLDFYMGVTAAGVDKRFPAKIPSNFYTPVLSDADGCSGLQAFESFFVSLGKFTLVFFRVAGNCTENVPGQFRMTIPEGGVFSDTNKAFGSGAGYPFPVQVSAVEGAAKVSLDFLPPAGVDTFSITGSFMYEFE